MLLVNHPNIRAIKIPLDHLIGWTFLCANKHRRVDTVSQSGQSEPSALARACPSRHVRSVEIPAPISLDQNRSATHTSAGHVIRDSSADIQADEDNLTSKSPKIGRQVSPYR
jgi:hypothetical protein